MMTSEWSEPPQLESEPLMDRDYSDPGGQVRARIRVYRSEPPGKYLVYLQTWPCREVDQEDWSYLEARTCCLNKKKIREWLAFGASIGVWFYGQGEDAWQESINRMSTTFILELNRGLPDDVGDA